MKNFLVLINGPMGAGKTTIGKILHSKLKRTAVLSTDSIKFFISDFERGDRDNAISTAVLMQMCKEYIRHGINIVLPQKFWKKEYIEPYVALAAEHGMTVFVYQLEAPKDILLERIKHRPKPARAKTPVPEDRILKNMEIWESNRYEMGKVFNTYELSAEEIADSIIKDLEV